MRTKIGLFFGSSTGNCETIARMLAEELNPIQVDIYDLFHHKGKRIPKYKNYIFGVPTWGKFEMQEDWDEFLSGLNGEKFSGRNVALYGLGDQKLYPRNFVDGMGAMYEWLTSRNANIIGRWPIEGYNFSGSIGIRDDKFVGLALDEDRQSDLTQKRVREWAIQLKKELQYEL